MDENCNTADAIILAVVAFVKVMDTAPDIWFTITLEIFVPAAIPVPETYIPAEYILVPPPLLAIAIVVEPLVTAVDEIAPEKVPLAPSVFKVY
jgi:hypothetical protein